MSTTKINVALPDDVLYELKSFPGVEISVDARLQLNMAIGMFATKSVSLAKAAEIAGLPLEKFIDTLNELKISSIDYTAEALEDDLNFAKGF